MKNIFVVILRYVAPLESIDQCRASHVEFLESYYAKGVFLISGRQAPVTGGVILARASSRQALWDILHQDPFYTEHLAEYQVFEFTPNRASPLLEALMEEEINK